MCQEKNSSTKKSRRHGRSALRAALLSFAVCLTIFSVIGGSIAWLMASTDPIVNVFTYGEIRITLTETKGEELSDGRYFKMTPGKVIEKDPKVAVLENSEDCWLFIKIDKSTNKPLDDYITYEIADGWTAMPNVSGVYYREVDSSTQTVSFSVLKNDRVTAKGTLTQQDLETLNASNYPKMTLTAYAVQRDASIADIDTVQEAWALVAPSNN